MLQAVPLADPEALRAQIAVARAGLAALKLRAVLDCARSLLKRPRSFTPMTRAQKSALLEPVVEERRETMTPPAKDQVLWARDNLLPPDDRQDVEGDRMSEFSRMVRAKPEPMVRLLALGLLAASFACGPGTGALAQQPAPAAVPVGTVLAEKRAITQTADFVGRIEAVNLSLIHI